MRLARSLSGEFLIGKFLLSPFLFVGMLLHGANWLVTHAPGICSPQLIYCTGLKCELEHCSHVWGGAPSTLLSCLDRVQRKVIRMVKGLPSRSTLQSLAHREVIASLSRCYFGFCSSRLASTVPFIVTFSLPLAHRKLIILIKFRLQGGALPSTNLHSPRASIWWACSNFLHSYLQSFPPQEKDQPNSS